ncbi:class II aldolase/adducin family protein [Novosphingobium marinum]|uniref:HCOMODA/2-hydroxy-3-carboxy-muconic semialdehyde decarboxylase n=2 Tax=Novosphingobium marinum TaxID=1514948 RepID=A0A7Y9XZB8_9SPHN|nr:class II aldolase/adducin family protein [Novosphingobium marinum]NYH97165.1 HCOMODA/2-hydroxy-3-carboxy-muconic semialdehyde decarboxylase [Novosphingobium marinum]
MADQDIEEKVRLAARGLGRAGLVHAYGHCSARVDADHFLVCAAMPMVLIKDEPSTLVPVQGPLPEGVLGEVRAHQAIYLRRPDVGGICRIMPPAVMALSTRGITPLPRHGLGAYFAPCPPLWNDPRLLRDDGAAAALAVTLGDARAVVMRANGAITVGTSLEEAATFAFMLEDAAKIERDVRAMGFDPAGGLLESDEIAARQTLAGGVVDRMWRWLTESEMPSPHTGSLVRRAH